MKDNNQEFDYIFEEYIDFVIKNCSAPILTDRNFFLFMSTKDEVIEILSQKNVDIQKLSLYCKEELGKENRYNSDYERSEVYYNEKSNISGFMGRIFERTVGKAQYKNFLDEMSLAITLAHKEPLKPRIFDFASNKDLNEIAEMGFLIDNINPEIANDIDNCAEDYNNDCFVMIGDDLLDDITAGFSSASIFDSKSSKNAKIVGFEEETQKIMHILSRKHNPSVLITGQEGVGKQSLLEKVRSKLSLEDIDYADFSKLLEGDDLSASEFGEDVDYSNAREVIFKASMKNQVLLVEEINQPAFSTLISAMKKIDLKLVCINNKPHAPMVFPGEVIKIKQAKKDKTLEILKAHKSLYQNFYDINISENTLNKVIDYSYKHILSKAQPLASLEFLDTACVYAKNERRLKDVHLISALKEIYNVPKLALDNDEQAKILKLSEDLSKNIIGQKDAFDKIRKKMLQQIVFPEAGKPKMSFLFAGSSGVGKTQTAKDLAKLLGVPVLQYNMGQYQEEHSISKLLGSPPGYIGSESGGELVKNVNKNPNALIILDEIEKANPVIHKMWLEVLDESTIKDGKGNVARFDNNIIVLTSNAGFSSFDTRSKIGYSDNKNDNGHSEKALVEKLSKSFAPEFLNRINDIVYFKPLNDEDAKKIVELNLSNVKESFLEKQKINIEFSENSVIEIMKKGINPKFGARGLKNYINQNIKSEIARAYIAKEIKAGAKVCMDYDADKKKYNLKSKVAKSRVNCNKRSVRGAER